MRHKMGRLTKLHMSRTARRDRQRFRPAADTNGNWMWTDSPYAYLDRSSIRGRHCVGRDAPMTTLVACFRTMTYLDSVGDYATVFRFYGRKSVGGGVSWGLRAERIRDSLLERLDCQLTENDHE